MRRKEEEQEDKRRRFRWGSLEAKYVIPSCRPPKGSPRGFKEASGGTMLGDPRTRFKTSLGHLETLVGPSWSPQPRLAPSGVNRIQARMPLPCCTASKCCVNSVRHASVGVPPLLKCFEGSLGLLTTLTAKFCRPKRKPGAPRHLLPNLSFLLP